MKVALIVEGVFPEKKGGLERWYGFIAKELIDSGHEVVYFNASNVSEKRNGIHFVDVTQKSWDYLPGGLRSTKDSIKFARGLFKKLSKFDIDIIYCSSVPILSLFSVWLVAKLRRKPMIAEWFEFWSLKYWIQYQKNLLGVVGWLIQILACQLGDKLIVFNDSAMKKIAFFKLRNVENILKLPGQCGSPSDLNLTESNKLKSDMIFLGRFVDEKQPDLAIKLAVRLHKYYWFSKLKIFGTGPNSAALESLIKQNSAEAYIEVIENAADSIIKEAMTKSFVLFHPTKREGYGYAQVEAAYFGLPTILVKYPENASTELMINPNLYANNDQLDSLENIAVDAFTNQNKYRGQTREWAIQASQTRSSKISFNQIQEIMVDLLQRNFQKGER